MGQAAIAALDLDDPALLTALFGHVTRHRQFFHEFFFPDPDDTRPDPRGLEDYVWHPGNHLKLFWSQLPLTLWNRGCLMCARGVAKTSIGQRQVHLHRAIRTPHTVCLQATRRKMTYVAQHLDPTLEVLRRHALLRHFFESVSSDESNPEVRLVNGSILRFRHMGQTVSGRQAENAQGYRAHFLSLDEAQQLEDGHLQEILHAPLVDWTDPRHIEEREAGFRELGVPNGVVDSPVYTHDVRRQDLFTERLELAGPDGATRSELVSWVWKIPKVAMPWYSAGKHAQDLAATKCKPEQGLFTDRYLQDTLGLWGRPAERRFPWSVREPVSRHLPDWHNEYLSHAEYERHTSRGSHHRWRSTDFRFLHPRMPAEVSGVYGFGIDVGTTESTIVVALVQEAPKRWRWQWLLEMEGWRETWDQAVIIDYLTQRYRPRFIGIDKLSEGHGIHGTLKRSPSFEGIDYESLLYEYAGSNTVTVGFEPDPIALREARTEAQRQRIRRNPRPIERTVKVFTMDDLRDRMLQQTLILPSLEQAPDVHFELDLITRTCVRDARGGARFEFHPEHPHTVSALQMFCMAEYQWAGRAHDAAYGGPRPRHRVTDLVRRLAGPIYLR